jgi:hypothetical protein
MGGRGTICGIFLASLAVFGCQEEPKRSESIEIRAADRSCEEGERCGVVETSCTSMGCGCGVAVRESRLLHYQRKLAECRGQESLAVCDSNCETPFGKCFEGACVLTSEPPEMFRRGRSVQRACERTRGEYVGCPDCSPNERCRSCKPCVCPSTHRWTAKGCRRVVRAEARNIPIETRPSRVRLSDAVKTRVSNDTRRTIWLKTRCGTPFFRARKKEDAWETRYELSVERDCKEGAIELDPGDKRPFVVRSLPKLRAPDGGSPTPGTYRFEVTYTDNPKSFRHHGIVYSGEVDLVHEVSQR